MALLATCASVSVCFLSVVMSIELWSHCCKPDTYSFNRGAGEGLCSAAVLFFIIFFNDSFQTIYLNIYWTDLCKICQIGRTLAIIEWSEAIFLICQGTLQWQPILWAKLTFSPHLVVRMTFARAAPAYGKKGSCYAEHRQTNYLIWWMQVNQLSDKLTGGDGVSWWAVPCI